MWKKWKKNYTGDLIFNREMFNDRKKIDYNER